MKECQDKEHYGMVGDKACQCGFQPLNDSEDWQEYSGAYYKGKEQWYITVKPKEQWDETD